MLEENNDETYFHCISVLSRYHLTIRLCVLFKQRFTLFLLRHVRKLEKKKTSVGSKMHSVQK